MRARFVRIIVAGALATGVLGLSGCLHLHARHHRPWHHARTDVYYHAPYYAPYCDTTWTIGGRFGIRVGF